ncbi:type I-E CRISPR-associated protein Cse1/CasA [Limobrevibacterium gyesilva]|uniref:Type I-E CRISPR-associated protein Cse1/CasA n=1 Tax=Limobrevibacterium gyesilva TaxID=2991712 RepID=A0AA41YQI4_9PROT|nr:type I-E CRISPR-associated protein Cse1/CasA [Limobrevibacterium gyesilva]MCW3476876.1 type I-E CRISPR-associated protein Cse1/CasA [Limobrevibacterium gyesilva]
MLSDAWVPVRRASGRALTVRLCDITDAITTDPIVALDWPRPDFRLAGLEFLIGLLATACPPADDDGTDEPGGWLDWWKVAPSPDVLAEAFAPFAHAFVLDGDGPRFMQDLEDVAGDANRIETLLIDAPGGQTLKKNADHFVKRNAVATMGRAAAAMALFTLQSFAPAGGAGNRVGLRGGGPLTTLAVPPRNGSLPLWHLLWANVPVGEVPTPEQLPRIFPWLAPTRTSEAGRSTTPTDTHDRHAFWGMARRIRLEFADNVDSASCDLSGATDSVVVRAWRQRPYGTNYAAWEHPLSPYYRQKPTDAQWLPVHAQPGGVGYRHWVGLIFADAATTRRAARCISRFRERRLWQVAKGGDRLRWRLLAAGYDMDNMKARGFVESEMPVIEPGDPQRTEAFVQLLRQLIAGANDAAALLGRAVRRALFSDGAKVALDAGLLTTLRERFWATTEPAFLERVQAAAGGAIEAEAVRRQWLRDLAGAAAALFAEAAPIDATGADRRPDRIAAAAKGLRFALNGYGKDGESLFRALGLPPPAVAKPKSVAKAGKRRT